MAINTEIARNAWPRVPWANGDYHTLTSEQVEAVLWAAKECGYRKPKNANGSRARYFFYAVQRKMKRERG